MRSVVMCLAVLGVLWLCGLASSGGTGLGVGAIGAGIAVVFGALGAIYDFSPTVLWPPSAYSGGSPRSWPTA